MRSRMYYNVPSVQVAQSVFGENPFSVKPVELLKEASDQERGLAITKDRKALAKLEKR